MKRTTGIFALIILLVWGGCSKADYNIPGQKQNFITFMNNAGYAWDSVGGVYRVHLLAGEGPQAANGDSVYFNYIGQTFSSRLGDTFTTNIKEEAKKAKLDTTYLDFSPKGVRSGDGSLMRGLESGLTGCRQGDSLLLLITSDLAYGDQQVGYVPAGTPVTFVVNVLKVKK